MSKQIMKILRVVFILSFLPITAFADNRTTGAMVVSVSSNGKYAISSNQDKKIILWNIANKTYKVISKNGNIYSAYFIKNTNDFMWQDLNDIVHVQDVNGNEILSFHNFPTYGEVMTSDLKNYFASDINWVVYSGYGKSQKIVKPSYGDGSDFIGNQKLLNLTLSYNDKYLLLSGSGNAGEKNKNAISISKSQIFDGKYIDDVTLWYAATKEPIFKFPGNVFSTVATISPNDKYIVSIDEDDFAYLWDLKTGKRLLHLWDIYGGHARKVTKYGLRYDFDTTGLIKPPAEFAQLQKEAPYAIYSVRFIGNNHYLRFDDDEPWAILYNVHDPRPVKYLPLGSDPMPSLDDPSRDAGIDTSPAAHILVMGQENSDGIIVYQYDPATKTLEKIWAPSVSSWF